ncbi:MAG: ATP-binding protein [Bacteroidaceae bacterium]|nr:ATP-binding protein [Bacteroidaceae bacterium]
MFSVLCQKSRIFSFFSIFVEYYCRPIISTTNLPFTRWEEVLKDKGLCSALVDRMSHKSFFVNITGTSYRVKEKNMSITSNV